MQKVTLESFKVIGISVRTTNQNGQAGKDIPALWDKFMSEGILEKIPNKVDPTIYSIYTDYESDHLNPYTTVLGCKVNSDAKIPEGMVCVEIANGNHNKFVAKGDLTQGVVYGAWTKIWEIEMPRKYTADYETYGENAQNPLDAEVDIFVAIE